MEKIRIGVIGIGDISDVYLNNLKKYDAVEVVACASRGLEKAQRKAAQHGIPKAYASGAEVIADPDVDLVLNLEARGTSGPALMFETSTNNSAVAGYFPSHVKQPVAGSLFPSL